MKPNGEVNKQLIKNCEKLGLTHEGDGKFTVGKGECTIFYEFDLSASGYEFEHIAKNIVNQL